MRNDLTEKNIRRFLLIITTSLNFAALIVVAFILTSSENKYARLSMFIILLPLIVSIIVNLFYWKSFVTANSNE